MFFNRIRAAETTQTPKTVNFQHATPTLAGSSKFTPQSKGAFIGILTFLSMFGPGKFRVFAQRALTVITMVSFVTQTIKSKRNQGKS